MPADVAHRTVAVSRPEIQAALARVVGSGPFLRSGQLQRLLRFIVEETLAGRGDSLKEYVVGVEVFGRPASYDPRLDSLVRVEARRLRAALDAYYRDEGLNDPVVIELHKGGYSPSFRRLSTERQESAAIERQDPLPSGSPRSTRFTCVAWPFCSRATAPERRRSSRRSSVTPGWR